MIFSGESGHRPDTSNYPTLTSVYQISDIAKQAKLAAVHSLLPAQFNHYWEPFVGSNPLFFALRHRISGATISDISKDLIDLYQTLRDKPEIVIPHLLRHQDLHIGTEYIRRVIDSKPKERVEKAARLLYLCALGHRHQQLSPKPSGHQELNSSVQALRFNEGSLARLSQALQGISIESKPYLFAKPALGDLIYCDPPFHSVKGPFDRSFAMDNQIRLSAKVIKWHLDGVQVLIANSDTPLVRDLYRAGEYFTIRRFELPAPLDLGRNWGNPNSMLVITNIG